MKIIMSIDAAISSIKDIIPRIVNNVEKGNGSLIEALIGQVAINRKKREAIIEIFIQHRESVLNLINGRTGTHSYGDEIINQSHIDLLKTYEAKVNIDCEISSIISPPKSAYVLVKCMRDCGTIIVTSGLLSITKGSILYVSPEDVKNLIDIHAVEVLE